jgi:hypothetical protein
VLSRTGRLRPADAWPNLRLLSCWKGGTMPLYLRRLPELYGSCPIRDIGYMASEGRGATPLVNAGAAGVLSVTSHFFEFVRAAERDLAAPDFLTCDRLEPDQEYYIFLTTSAGLYRYDINDIVRVVDFHRDTPVIEFVRKGGGVTSITGEKLYESHVIEAMDRAVARRPHLKPSFFVLYADLAAANYKLCVEHDRRLERAELDELLARFEAALGEVNIEYPYKRASLRIKDPEIFSLPQGASVRLIQHIGQRSAQDNQAKVPRLSRDVDEHFRLFDLDLDRDPGTRAAA